MIIGLIYLGCANEITYPPVSESATGIVNSGQFVWHDLATSNPNGAMDFYGEVFGWQFETLGSDDHAYHIIKNEGESIGGIFKLADKYGAVSEWVGSMSVANVDASVTFNQDQGGKIIFKASEFKGREKTALIQDPQGAIVALLTSESGDPEPGTVFGFGAFPPNFFV